MQEVRVKNVKVIYSQNYLIISCETITTEAPYQSQVGCKSGDMPSIQTQDHINTAERLKLENAFLVKMLQAAEEKNHWLCESIKLLEENKKLLEKKLNA